jgi:hypothetical protein
MKVSIVILVVLCKFWKVLDLLFLFCIFRKDDDSDETVLRETSGAHGLTQKHALQFIEKQVCVLFLC